MFDYLSNAEDGKKADYCMAGYLIENTVTENGTVSRGIYSADKDETLHPLSSAQKYAQRALTRNTRKTAAKAGRR